MWVAGHAAIPARWGVMSGWSAAPGPRVHFRRNNLVGATIIPLAAALPSVALRGWSHRTVRRSAMLIGRVAAAGCRMHALTLEVLGILSLRGRGRRITRRDCGCRSTAIGPTCRTRCSTSHGCSSRAASRHCSRSPLCPRAQRGERAVTAVLAAVRSHRDRSRAGRWRAEPAGRDRHVPFWMKRTVMAGLVVEIGAVQP